MDIEASDSAFTLLQLCFAFPMQFEYLQSILQLPQCFRLTVYIRTLLNDGNQERFLFNAKVDSSNHV